MLLQVALDGELQPSLDILAEVINHIDIAEVGTPLIFREGMYAVRTFKEYYPTLTVLADLKIMDAGEMEADIAFENGADIVTVLGVAADATIEGVIKSAQKYNRQVLVDMIEVPYPIARGRELVKMGCDYICIHTAYDLVATGVSPLKTLQNVREEMPHAALAIAGGVKLETIDDIIPLDPQIVVVGGGITGADSPVVAAHALRERMPL